MAHSSNILDVFIKLLRSLECPVCYEYVSSPIYQCSSGHIICGRCYCSLSNCPTCRATIHMSSRARSIEEISDIMLFPCRNDGCDEVLPLTLLRGHEERCEHANAFGGRDEKVRLNNLHSNLLLHLEQHIAPFFVTQPSRVMIDQETQTEEYKNPRDSSFINGPFILSGKTSPMSIRGDGNCEPDQSKDIFGIFFPSNDFLVNNCATETDRVSQNEQNPGSANSLDELLKTLQSYLKARKPGGAPKEGGGRGAEVSSVNVVSDNTNKSSGERSSQPVSLTQSPLNGIRSKFVSDIPKDIRSIISSIQTTLDKANSGIPSGSTSGLDRAKHPTFAETSSAKNLTSASNSESTIQALPGTSALNPDPVAFTIGFSPKTHLNKATPTPGIRNKKYASRRSTIGQSSKSYFSPSPSPPSNSKCKPYINFKFNFSFGSGESPIPFSTCDSLLTESNIEISPIVSPLLASVVDSKGEGEKNLEENDNNTIAFACTNPKSNEVEHQTNRHPIFDEILALKNVSLNSSDSPRSVYIRDDGETQSVNPKTESDNNRSGACGLFTFKDVSFGRFPDQSSSIVPTGGESSGCKGGEQKLFTFRRDSLGSKVTDSKGNTADEHPSVSSQRMSTSSDQATELDKASKLFTITKCAPKLSSVPKQSSKSPRRMSAAFAKAVPIFLERDSSNKRLFCLPKSQPACSNLPRDEPGSSKTTSDKTDSDILGWNVESSGSKTDDQMLFSFRRDSGGLDTSTPSPGSSDATSPEADPQETSAGERRLSYLRPSESPKICSRKQYTWT